VPKKTKIVQNKNLKSSTTAKKSASAGKKKIVAKTPAAKKSKPVQFIGPSDEEIRTRAYFISERRHRLALPGDASSDWIEARRQLLYETGPA
jgi:hypothetical protein